MLKKYNEWYVDTNEEINFNDIVKILTFMLHTFVIHITAIPVLNLYFIIAGLSTLNIKILRPVAHPILCL